MREYGRESEYSTEDSEARGKEILPEHSEFIEEIDYLISEGQLLSARLKLKRYLERSPDPRLIFKYALVNIELGLYDEAENWLKRLVEREPDNPDAIFNLALSLSKQGKYLEASLYYKRYVQLRQDPEGYNNLGICYDRLEKIEEALQAYTKAIELDQNYVNALLNKGNLLLYLRRYSEAVELLRRAYELDSTNYLACYSLGMAKFLIGDYDTAEVFMKRAVSINPYSGDGYFTLGQIASLRGDLVTAARYYHRAVLANPRDYKALEKALELYDKVEEFEELENLITHIGDDDKHLPSYLREKLRFYRLKLELKSADKSVSERALNTIRELANELCTPTDVRVLALRLLAELKETSGELEDALHLISEAIKLKPFEVDLLVRRAEMYNKIGKYREAYIDLKKALKLNPKLEGIYSEILRDLEDKLE